MSFPKYPEYKDSNIGWLAEVPAHWDILRLKRICSLITERTDRREYPVALENIESWTGRYIETENDFSGEGVAFETGDILFGKLRPYLAKVLVATHAGEAVGDFHVLRPLTFLSGYLQWILLTKELISIIDGSTFGAKMPRASWDFMGSLELPHPPHQEQSAIAAFLDRETAKIDALVAEQEKLIELLKEKRQAVISHAVTKGLDPNVPMKDSGDEWLGEVPEHWSIITFQRCVHVAEGQVDPEEEPYASMTLIAPNHVESSSGRILALETALEQGAESGKYLCQPSDVIYSKIRPALRKVCLSPGDCLCSADMYPLRPFGCLIREFLFWFILSEQFSSQSVLESERVAMPKINRESLKAVRIGVPSLPEQESIVRHLESESSRIDALVTESQRAIDLLKERRSALISAAVTGKIDVRGLADATQ